MKHYLLTTALLLLASCAGTKKLPVYTAAQQEQQRKDISYWKPDSTAAPIDSARNTKPALAIKVPLVAAPDSLPFVVVQRKPTVFDRLFNHTPKATIYAGTPQVKAGKKSVITINQVQGNQSNTSSSTSKNATSATGAGATSTQVEKPKAPVTTGPGDATDQSGSGAASTIKGNGNAPVLTNTQQQAPNWKAQLASGFATPVGKVLSVVLLGLVGYGVYRLWPLLRRKSSDDKQAQA